MTPMGTLRQYERASRERFFADNPDIKITRAEFDREYPPDSRLYEWLTEIEKAAKAGEVFRPVVLDDIYRRGGWLFMNHLHKAYPTCLPAGYLTPNVRRANAENRAEMVAAGRRA